MIVYELKTKNGCRLYETYKGANRAIEEDIADMKSIIISDTRDGEHRGKVVTEYDNYWGDGKWHDVYEIREVPLYE